jgi:hypothetical protein
MITTAPVPQHLSEDEALVSVKLRKSTAYPDTKKMDR